VVELTKLVFMCRWWVWEEWTYRWVQDIHCTDEPDLVVTSWLLHKANRPRWC